VKEWNDEIVFVRRVIPGAADRSYGIQVACRPSRSRAPQAKPKKKITVAPVDDSQLSLL
jgi:DNA mismatch repair protein MutS